MIRKLTVFIGVLVQALLVVLFFAAPVGMILGIPYQATLYVGSLFAFVVAMWIAFDA